MMNTGLLCRTGILTAAVFAVTRFLQIPIPLGYFNVGNAVILLASLFLPLPYGVFMAAAGSALADLTSYPVYTVPTLLIKGMMVVLFSLLIRKSPGSRPRIILGAAAATLLPLAGYTVTGALLYGGFWAGAAQIPGLLAEYAANLVLVILLLPGALRLQALFRK